MSDCTCNAKAVGKPHADGCPCAVFMVYADQATRNGERNGILPGHVTYVDDPMVPRFMPDPPTLAQITERAIDDCGDIWIALKLWRGRQISDAGSIGQIDGLIAGELDAAYEAGRRDERRESCAIYETGTGIMESAIAEQRVVIDRLKAWKSSAMDVMRPLQDIAKEFGLPLGASITEAVVALVRSQAVSIAELRTTIDRSERLPAEVRKQLDGAVSEIERLRNPPAPEPVSRVASPSISARWNDGPGMG